MDRISLFKMSGLPDPFGVVVLVFSFVLLLSPWLAGSDFGIFKVPAFANTPRKWLRIIGPAVFLFAVFAYLPIFSGSTASIKASSDSNPELKPLLTASNASFFEGFTEAKLPAYWTVIEDDSKNWTIQSKPPSLVIVTQNGSIWENGKNLKNQFRLDRELPKTDYEIVVKANFQLQGVGNELFVAIFKDDDNFIAIGYRAEMDLGHIKRFVHFMKEEAGKDNSVDPQVRGEGAEPPVTFYLKIERRGHQFNGYYSFVENRPPENLDDIRWSRIGTHAWINFDGRLSLWATNSYRDPPQSQARFDFVVIRPLKG